MKEYKVTIQIERLYNAENIKECRKYVNENYDDVEEFEMDIEEMKPKQGKD